MELTTFSLKVKGLVDKDKAPRLKRWLRDAGLKLEIICL